MEKIGVFENIPLELVTVPEDGLAGGCGEVPRRADV